MSNQNKKRILFVGEYSQLCTGFSTIGYYLLPRLYKNKNYEIAELATYTHQLHPRINDTDWKVYPNEPHPFDQESRKRYDSDPMNQFGKWKLDEVCLDFQPDIIVTWRDNWMDNFINKSPYRKYFKYITMPTCDGSPQKIEWLEDYAECDKVLAYSYYGKSVLEQESNGKIKICAVPTPGSDLDIFKPIANKAEHRKSIGLSPNLFVLGTVMRNQPRKLYTDLLKAFNKYLQLCKENSQDDLAKSSFMYWHTTNPDVGWDIPTEIQKHGLSHKILFTYKCEACGFVLPMLFNGEVTTCRKCMNHSMRFPNTAIGVSREQLAAIMAGFDLYIQYSCSEGLGMPINDAKSCGVPTMTVQHSAMIEQAYNGGGIPIEVIRHYQEPINATSQLRALPDNDDAAQKIYNFATASPEYKEKLSKEARACVEQYYNWDNIAKVWEEVIDSIEIEPIEKRWLSKPNYIHMKTQIPGNLSNEGFVKWCYENILCQPEKFNGSLAQRTISILNAGYEAGMDGMGRPIRQGVDRNKIIQNMANYVHNNNMMEDLRYNKLVLKDQNKPEINFGTIYNQQDI